MISKCILLVLFVALPLLVIARERPSTMLYSDLFSPKQSGVKRSIDDGSGCVVLGGSCASSTHDCNLDHYCGSNDICQATIGLNGNCTDEDSCADGGVTELTCATGKCLPRWAYFLGERCIADESCAGGGCRDGVCKTMEAAGTCSYSTDCSPSTYCSDSSHTCIPVKTTQGEACTDSEQCAFNLVCSSSKCVPILSVDVGGNCDSEMFDSVDQCKPGLSCFESTCQTQSLGRACNTTGDCGDDQYCNSSKLCDTMLSGEYLTTYQSLVDCMSGVAPAWRSHPANFATDNLLAKCLSLWKKVLTIKIQRLDSDGTCAPQWAKKSAAASAVLGWSLIFVLAVVMLL